MCFPNIWLCLFVYVLAHNVETVERLTSIDTVSCLGGREVTLQTAVPEDPSSISGFWSIFMFVVFL